MTAQARFCQRRRRRLLLPVSGVSSRTCAEISQRARCCPWQRSRYRRLESRHNLPLRPQFFVHADCWQCLRRRRGQSLNRPAIWLPPGFYEGNTPLPCGCQRRKRRRSFEPFPLCREKYGVASRSSRRQFFSGCLAGQCGCPADGCHHNFEFFPSCREEYGVASRSLRGQPLSGGL